mmetsp:Transcript_89618/g.204844  ORF Transcript_89618/g.204844 Transcript_89618/m.204844 type:complete len:299 (+) Transcript_89618:315-1211(+)
MSTETAVTFSGTAELGIHPSRTTADHREGQRDCCSRTPQRMLPWPDTTQRQPPSRRPEQRPTTPGETDRSQAELPRMLRQPERQPLPIPTDHRAHRTDNRPWKGADNWCLRYRKGKLEQNRTPTRTRRRHRTQKSKQQLPYLQHLRLVCCSTRREIGQVHTIRQSRARTTTRCVPADTCDMRRAAVVVTGRLGATTLRLGAISGAGRDATGGAEKSWFCQLSGTSASAHVVSSTCHVPKPRSNLERRPTSFRRGTTSAESSLLSAKRLASLANSAEGAVGAKVSWRKANNASMPESTT